MLITMLDFLGLEIEKKLCLNWYENVEIFFSVMAVMTKETFSFSEYSFEIIGNYI
jgi:hypothetical protein